MEEAEGGEEEEEGGGECAVLEGQPQPTWLDKVAAGAPKGAPLSRPRVQRLKAANKPRGKGKGPAPKSSKDMIAKRALEFVLEGLVEEKGDLFCTMCRISVGAAATAAKRHCECDAHKTNKQKRHKDPVQLCEW